MTSLAAKRDDLAALVVNTNQTAGAIADESTALDATLAALPTTLRKANTTFVNLRSTLADLTVLVDESKPATKDLAKWLRTLRPLIVAATPTIQQLDTLISKPGPANDATDLLNETPTLAKSAATVFPRSITALKKSQPVIQYIRPYAPDFSCGCATSARRRRTTTPTATTGASRRASTPSRSTTTRPAACSSP